MNVPIGDRPIGEVISSGLVQVRTERVLAPTEIKPLPHCMQAVGFKFSSFFMTVAPSLYIEPNWPDRVAATNDNPALALGARILRGGQFVERRPDRARCIADLPPSFVVDVDARLEPLLSAPRFGFARHENLVEPVAQL